MLRGFEIGSRQQAVPEPINFVTPQEPKTRRKENEVFAMGQTDSFFERPLARVRDLPPARSPICADDFQEYW